VLSRGYAMPAGTRIGATQPTVHEHLPSALEANNAEFSSWLSAVERNEGVAGLFELETWLRGLRAFFDTKHLPLSTGERAGLLERDFSPEIRIVRQVVMDCDRYAGDIIRLGPQESLRSEAFIRKQLRGAGEMEFHRGRPPEQWKAEDSLAELIVCLSDMRVLLDALPETAAQTLQLFQSLGRLFHRQLRMCSYIDRLLCQPFKLQYDRVDSPVLVALLRGINEDVLRNGVTTALLYLFRFLRYLKFIERDLNADVALRRSLVVFALLHEEMSRFSELIKLRFLDARNAQKSLRSAAELVFYSIRVELRKVQERELLFLSRESGAAVIYTRVENSHGLLLNCCQSCIVTLMQSLDRSLDAKSLFPSMVEGRKQAIQLRQSLWDLRHYMKDTLDQNAEVEINKIVERLAAFRESSLQYLMYKDWGEFEKFADALIGAGSQIEARTRLRDFIGFLETLVQEVSKRSVLR
jgi:hypothetical protein